MNFILVNINITQCSHHYLLATYDISLGNSQMRSPGVPASYLTPCTFQISSIALSDTLSCSEEKLTVIILLLFNF